MYNYKIQQEELLAALETEALDFASQTERLLRGKSALVASITAEIWLRKALNTSLKSTRKLTKECDKFVYDSGLLGQNILNFLLKIDGVDCTDNKPLRERRRTLVRNIQSHLLVDADAIQACAKQLRNSSLLQRCADLDCKIQAQVPSEGDPEDSAVSCTTSVTPTSGMSEPSSSPSDSEESTSVALDDSSSDCSISSISSADSLDAPLSSSCAADTTTPTPDVPPSRSTRYYPQFYERQLRNGNVLLSAKLSGVDPANIKVSFNQAGRTITVSGEGMESASRHIWFEKVFSIPKSLSMDQKCITVEFDEESETFLLLLPRRPRSQSYRTSPFFHQKQPYFQPKHCSQRPSSACIYPRDYDSTGGVFENELNMFSRSFTCGPAFGGFW